MEEALRAVADHVVGALLAVPFAGEGVVAVDVEGCAAFAPRGGDEFWDWDQRRRARRKRLDLRRCARRVWAYSSRDID